MTFFTRHFGLEIKAGTLNWREILGRKSFLAQNLRNSPLRKRLSFGETLGAYGSHATITLVQCVQNKLSLMCNVKTIPQLLLMISQPKFQLKMPRKKHVCFQYVAYALKVFTKPSSVGAPRNEGQN